MKKIEYIEENIDESTYKSNLDVGTSSNGSEEFLMETIDVEEVIKSVKYFRHDFFSLRKMKYMMVTKIKVKELRKVRQQNGDNCSDLGPDEFNIKVGRYEKDENGEYKLDVYGEKIKYFYTKKQIAVKYLYFVGGDHYDVRREDNHEIEYFQLNDEFVEHWLCNPEFQHKGAFLKKCKGRLNTWIKIPNLELLYYFSELEEDRITLLED